MFCDKYKDALSDAAAGAPLPIAVQQHIDDCERCRATLLAQQTVFAAVDAGLCSRTNSKVPANFDHRLRAALEIEVRRLSNRTWSALGFASVTIVAAVLVMAVLFTQTSNQERKESAGGLAHQTVTPITVTHPNSTEIQPSGRKTLHSLPSGLNAQRRSNRLGGENKVEVLVSQGQQELVVKYMQQMAVRRVQVGVNANLQHEPEMKPVEVAPVVISKLVVNPLPDLSSN